MSRPICVSGSASARMLRGAPRGHERQNKVEGEERVNSVLPPSLVLVASLFAWCSHPQWRGSVSSGLA